MLLVETVWIRLDSVARLLLDVRRDFPYSGRESISLENVPYLLHRVPKGCHIVESAIACFLLIPM